MRHSKRKQRNVFSLEFFPGMYNYHIPEKLREFRVREIEYDTALLKIVRNNKLSQAEKNSQMYELNMKYPDQVKHFMRVKHKDIFQGDEPDPLYSLPRYSG